MFVPFKERGSRNGFLDWRKNSFEEHNKRMKELDKDFKHTEKRIEKVVKQRLEKRKEKEISKKHDNVTFIVIDATDAYSRYICDEEILMTEGNSLSFRKCTIQSFEKKSLITN